MVGDLRSVRNFSWAMQPPLGVQPSFYVACFRSIALYMCFLPEMHAASHGFPWKKRPQMRGRIGEVGPPASGRSCFTVPYSHLVVLNGNPALRGQRRVPQEGRHEG